MGLRLFTYLLLSPSLFLFVSLFMAIYGLIYPYHRLSKSLLCPSYLWWCFPYLYHTPTGKFMVLGSSLVLPVQSTLTKASYLPSNAPSLTKHQHQPPTDINPNTKHQPSTEKLPNIYLIFSS